jgi:hypothetical protein
MKRVWVGGLVTIALSVAGCSRGEHAVRIDTSTVISLAKKSGFTTVHEVTSRGGFALIATEDPSRPGGLLIFKSPSVSWSRAEHRHRHFISARDQRAFWGALGGSYLRLRRLGYRSAPVCNLELQFYNPTGDRARRARFDRLIGQLQQICL